MIYIVILYELVFNNILFTNYFTSMYNVFQLNFVIFKTYKTNWHLIFDINLDLKSDGLKSWIGNNNSSKIITNVFI